MATKIIQLKDMNGNILLPQGYSASHDGQGNAFGDIYATITSVNTKANDNAVVHLTTTETITGSKTFNNNTMILKSTSVDVANSPSVSNSIDINWKDKNNVAYGVDCLRTDTSGNVFRYIYCKAHSSNTWQAIGIGFNSADNVFTYAPTPAASNSTSSSQIATVSWVNDASKSTNVVHRSGTETISGNKTFSGTVALGSSATATTQAASDNSTKLATTAWVKTNTPAKSDLTNCEVVVETYLNGTNWYRKYSDGWVEQGGVFTNGTSDSYMTGTVTLLVPMLNNTYYLCVFSNRSAGANLYEPCGYGKTTTSFSASNIVANAPGASWEVRGYAAT